MAQTLVQFVIDVKVNPEKGNTEMGIAQVKYAPLEANPVVVFFGTFTLLQSLCDMLPPTLLDESPQTRRLYDYIRHFADYMDKEDLMKPKP